MQSIKKTLQAMPPKTYTRVWETKCKREIKSIKKKHEKNAKIQPKVVKKAGESPQKTLVNRPRSANPNIANLGSLKKKTLNRGYNCPMALPQTGMGVVLNSEGHLTKEEVFWVRIEVHCKRRGGQKIIVDHIVDSRRWAGQDYIESRPEN